MPRKVQVVLDSQALADVGAAAFCASARESVAARRAFRVALAGGSTPRGVYQALAARTLSGHETLPWIQTHVYFGDERPVPPDHPESNYRMASESLLSRVPIPGENIHRIRGEESDPHRAARLYEEDLVRSFATERGQPPRFDLVLLGMGADGHTASLFPGSRALESRSLVEAAWVDRFATHRITLTPLTINHAARVVFLVSGIDKATALRLVLEGPFDPVKFPAQIVRPGTGDVLWLVDEAAAGQLDLSKESLAEPPAQ